MGIHWTRRVGLSAGCAMLTACATTPVPDERKVTTSEEVGNVYVTAYPAVPWSAIADKLEPRHDLSTADARALAAVTTQSQINQFLSTFAAGLAIGLPSRTHSSSSTTTDGKTTSTATRGLASGSVPDASGAAAVALSDDALKADLSKGAPMLGVDASTQLTGGTAVFQLAKILDNQITKSIAPQGYQAHLLTFQVNLQPKGRNLPYDAYVNITLMPASWRKAVDNANALHAKASEMPSIILYPLVISDAMESSSAARSVEVIRQAAFALSGVVSNVGVNAGLAGGTDKLNSLLGSDRNSILTVGRISDHTLRVRLGAQLQGSRAMALVPRTHNLSVVVFTKAGASDVEHLDKLAVVAEATFVDAATGVEVPSLRNTDEGRDGLREEVGKALKIYEFGLSESCPDSLYLLRALDRGDYRAVGDCLCDLSAQGTAAGVRDIKANSLDGEPKAIATCGPRKEAEKAASRFSVTALSRAGGGETLLLPADESRLRRLMAELMTVQTDSRFSKFLVQLTPYRNTELVVPPVSQLALLHDDTSAARVVLREGRNLDLTKLQARLKVMPDSQEFELLPTGMELDAGGRTLTLVFPSLLGNKLMASKAATKTAPAQADLDPRLALLVERPGADGSYTSIDAAKSSYRVKLLRPEKKGVGSPLSTASAVLLADGAGTARVTVLVGAWDAKEQGDLGIRVSGAEVRSTEPARSVDADTRAIPVSKGMSIVLTLGNVTPGRAVQISAIAGKQAIGDAITLAVVPAGATRK